MNLTLLFSFSSGLLGTFYLYFLSSKRLRYGGIVPGIALGLLSVVTGAFCLYTGALSIRPVGSQGFLSVEISRSVFHIEVWPWLVPISALCIFILWLIGHALDAFTEHAMKRGLVFSAAAVVCLAPLGYAMFILCFLAIFTGPSKSETELSTEFELRTGFEYPQTAIIKKTISYRSDSFGDWEGALIFQVPHWDQDIYRQLPVSQWEGTTYWQHWHQSICCDWNPSKFPQFSPPDGSMFVTEDEDYYKFLAIDHRSGTFYFLRSSW